MEYFDMESIVTPEMRKAAKKSGAGEYKYLKYLIEGTKGRIPKEIGEKITDEFFKCDGKYQLGIARTGNQNIEKVFADGYHIRGDIDSNVSFYTNRVIELPLLLAAYTDANEWRGGASNQLFVFKIPNESILKRYEGSEEAKPIISKESEGGFNGYSGARKVLPEYILGYFSVFQDQYIENPNYKDVHDYEDYTNLEHANIVSDTLSQSFSGDIKTKRPEEKESKNIFQKLMDFLRRDRRQKKLPAAQGQNEILGEEQRSFVKDQYIGPVDTEQALKDAEERVPRKR